MYRRPTVNHYLVFRRYGEKFIGPFRDNTRNYPATRLMYWRYLLGYLPSEYEPFRVYRISEQR